MKVKIEIDENNSEQEIIIRCKRLNDETQRIYNLLTDISKEQMQIILFKENVEYYINIADILFFETELGCVKAHCKDEMYDTKYKLYELEELLPGHFMRISKSTIINLNAIYSIKKNVTTSSEVQFYGTYKQVFVSRNYYKVLKIRLEEKRESL